MIRTRLFQLTAFVLFAVATPQSAFAYGCSVSVTNLAFGNVDVTSGATSTATATLTLSCTAAPSNRTLRMCVDIGGGSSSDTTSRKMISGGNSLRFQLYTDAAMTVPWGSWSAGLYGGGYQWDVFSSGPSFSSSTTVYGAVLGSQQTVTVNNYSSSLPVSLTYGKDNKSTCPDPGQGTATTSFTASASVTANCNVNASTLNFGSASILSSPIDASTTVSVQCTNGAPYAVALSAGNGTGATAAARKMQNGANNLTYALYSNSGRTAVWGDTSGTDTVSGTGSGNAQGYTIYGRVPAQTSPKPGTYTDSIIVTITY